MAHGADVISEGWSRNLVKYLETFDDFELYLDASVEDLTQRPDGK
ncbi:MAG: hypothetical protein R3E89_14720 [Thiolinea sp.]